MRPPLKIEIFNKINMFYYWGAIEITDQNPLAASDDKVKEQDREITASHSRASFENVTPVL